MDKHAKTNTNQHTDNTYTDAYTQLGKYRCAQTRKDMHRSIYADMHKHSKTGTDQHAQIRHVQMLMHR